MVGSRGSAPTGRFTYTTYRLPTGTLTIVYPLNLIRAGCGTRFRGMRSLIFAACGKKKTVIFHHFHNLPLSQKLDPRLVCIQFHHRSMNFAHQVHTNNETTLVVLIDSLYMTHMLCNLNFDSLLVFPQLS